MKFKVIYSHPLSQITPQTIRAIQSISRNLIPDMPDRIIAATAIEQGTPLITKDELIPNANVVEVVW